MSKKAIKKNREISLSNLIALYVLGGLILAVAAGYMLISPVYTKAQITKQKIGGVRSEISGLQQLDKDTETLRQNYEGVRDQRDKIINLLPGSNEEEKLLALLSETASKNSVVLSTFRPKIDTSFAQESVGTYEVYGATINVAGTYTALSRFLEELEQSARFVDVEAMTLAGDSTPGATNPGITAVLDLRAYYKTIEGSVNE